MFSPTGCTEYRAPINATVIRGEALQGVCVGSLYVGEELGEVHVGRTGRVVMWQG